MQVRQRELAQDLPPTVSAYDFPSVVVRFDSFFIRPLGFALSEMVSLPSCFYETSLHSLVLQRPSTNNNVGLALQLLLHRQVPMNATERAAFPFFSRHLAFTRRGAITATTEPQAPSAEELRVARRLAAEYLERQRRYLARLWAQCPSSVVVREAIDHLDRGALLRRDEIARLSALIATHHTSKSDLLERKRAYIAWREHAVEMQRRKERTLSRLLFDRERAAYELDLERLFFCTHCHQIVIPRELTATSPPEGSFCSVRAERGLLDALKEGLVNPDGDGFWGVCHPPVPAWVSDEAARPLAQSIHPHEEW